MPATPVKIGPFAGGLNTYSDPTAVGDTECIDLVNFDIDLDGSLYGRFPFLKLPVFPTSSGTGAVYLLGWFINTNMDRYLIVACTNSTFAYNYEAGTWSTISSTVGFTAMVQYQNKAWLVAPLSAPTGGGSWEPTGGFVLDNDIPRGNTAAIYKERLFVSGSGANANRVYFSNAADFATWNTSVNFFDARSGDGQSIIKLIVFADTIVIFKERGTYVFSYDSAPARGAVRVINSSIGITNRHSVIEYENSLYVHHGDSVYQLSNWQFTPINLKVPFVYVSRYDVKYVSEASLSVLSDRLIVHHYDTIYVFNLRNATWTTWQVAGDRNFNYFLQVPLRLPTEKEVYLAGSRDTTNDTDRRMFSWVPEYDPLSGEEMDCRVITKVYDFNVPYTFKRLFWWGVDLLSRNDLSYIVHPVQYTRAVTHADMSAFTHAQLSSGTHLMPLSVSVDVSDSMTISNSAGNRMFIKLLKSMRFRQIYFTVSGTTAGTILDAPLRIYSLIAFIDNKQLVSKEVS